jgi:hypothetical protein
MINSNHKRDNKVLSQTVCLALYYGHSLLIHTVTNANAQPNTKNGEKDVHFITKNSHVDLCGL